MRFCMRIGILRSKYQILHFSLFNADQVFSCQEMSKSPFLQRIFFRNKSIRVLKNQNFMLISDLKELFRKMKQKIIPKNSKKIPYKFVEKWCLGLNFFRCIFLNNFFRSQISIKLESFTPILKGQYHQKCVLFWLSNIQIRPKLADGNRFKIFLCLRWNNMNF